MRTVNEILLEKGPYFNYIEASASVRDAITLMKSQNISYLIVMEKGNYAGIVSERDYAHKIVLMNKHSNTTLVKEIMSTDLPVICGTDIGERCMILMNAVKSRYLPVFDGLDFKGVITIHDLMRDAIAENQRIIKSIPGKKFSRYYWI